MDIRQIVNDTKYNIRTQISLSSSLYQLVKEKARQEEKSLSAVIRESLVVQLQKELKNAQAQRERLKHLTERIRLLKRSGWTKVKNQRMLVRKWRKEDEEKRLSKIGLYGAS